jgi:hypothetical protein
MADRDGKANPAWGYESGGIAFVGCTLAGVGVGIWLDHVVAMTLICVGVGFIMMALLRQWSR